MTLKFTSAASWLIKLGCNANIGQQEAHHPPTGSSQFIFDGFVFLTFKPEGSKWGEYTVLLISGALILKPLCSVAVPEGVKTLESIPLTLRLLKQYIPRN